jgi:hypothetical protein
MTAQQFGPVHSIVLPIFWRIVSLHIRQEFWSLVHFMFLHVSSFNHTCHLLQWIAMVS